MFPAQCHLRHSCKREGLWQRGDDETPGIVHQSDGGFQIKMRCNACGAKSGALPRGLIDAWGITPDRFGWSKTNEPREHEPCVVEGCGLTPTEYHHFAPRNTFGVEADQWPVLPLCVAHHRAWHQRMDGYRWHRKGAAA